MIPLFYAAAALTLITTALAITRANAVHALLYFVVSLLGMAVIFFTLGAAFAAALEVIVYAGAIVVLFLFVVMMLSLDKNAARRERDWMARPAWAGPLILTAALGALLTRALLTGAPGAGATITPQQVGAKLLTTDLAAIELASMLLLAGLIGAFHLGRKT
jgi:NADH-quinone oxidoreductase subunit J